MDYAFIFLSNKVELLYQGLKDTLFYPGANPFIKRLIIVPSPAMKGYLKRKMAEDPDLRISFGLEFAFLDQGLENLKKNKSKRTPGAFELSLLIENELNSILKNESESLIWQPLITYLNSVKQHCSLAEDLARLFALYGEYGSKMISEWETNSEDWQAELWKRIYGKKNLIPLFRSFDDVEIEYQEIHLFGLSFISGIKNKFLKKIAETTPVYSWFLSPCQKLWSDIRSDRESNAISTFWVNSEVSLSNLENLVHLLRDRNLLLANFGKLGRYMATQLEDEYHQTHGSYEIAKELMHCLEYEALAGPETTFSEKPLTLLAAVQADLALMRVPQEKMKLEDSSIQLHSSSSILREVENAYQTLLKVIHESKEPIEPHEIIVMAPEITEYAPYINMVFGHKESQLDYQIMDLKLLSQGVLSQAFLQLVQLGQSRWEVADIIRLLSCPYFAKKLEIDAEDIAVLKAWLERQNITWGFTNLHRTELLEKNGFKPLVEPSEKGTWQEGIDLLLAGMVYHISDELDLPLLPKERIDLSNADLLGKLIDCLKNLKRDLLPIAHESEKTLSEWAIYFKGLLENYFAINHLEDEEESLNKAFLKLQRAAAEMPNSVFLASSIVERLRGLFEAKEYCSREKHFQAIRFSSLLPMRAVPAKVVLLMGLNHDIYPRKEKRCSLDRLTGYAEKDYCPSQTDYDRYLFLEAFLSARHTFMISYVAKGSSNGAKSPPSTIVSEFLDYLQSNYECDSSKIIFNHPFFPFDKAYFENGSRFKSFSEVNYRAALTYYAPKKVGPVFLRQFGSPATFEPKEQIVELKALLQLVKNPIQFYLNKALGIFLNKPQNDQPDFEVSSLNFYLLKQSCLKQPLEAVLAQAGKKRTLPFAPFDKIVEESLKEECGVIDKALQAFSLTREDVFDCEFSLSCREEYQTKDTLYLPPLTLCTEHGKVKIVGKLPLISKKGFLLLGKKEVKSAVRMYPNALLFSALPEGVCEKQFLMFEKHQVLPALENVQKHIIDLLSYFDLAHEMMSPLMPDWLPAILEGSHEKLQDVMLKADAFKTFQDPYLKWVLNEDAVPDALTIITNWQAYAKGLYQPILTAWELE